MSAFGYPNLITDPAAELVDGYRCAGTHGGRRCQLFTGHTDPHAAGWFEARPITPGQSHRTHPLEPLGR